MDWHFRPHKVKGLSFGKIVHNLLLTRFLVAAKRWSEMEGSYNLLKVRTCYELGSMKDVGDELRTEKKGKSIAVVPDGWLLFERKKEPQPTPTRRPKERG